MTTRSKTQQEPPVDASTVAQHFVQIWQDQWQNLTQQSPNAFADMQKQWLGALNPAANIGTPANFGQDTSHGQYDPTAGAALELATAALAASEQCLDLLKLTAQRLDELATRVATVDGSAKPKRAAKSSKAKPTQRPVKR